MMPDIHKSRIVRWGMAVVFGFAGFMAGVCTFVHGCKLGIQWLEMLAPFAIGLGCMGTVLLIPRLRTGLLLAAGIAVFGGACGVSYADYVHNYKIGVENMPPPPHRTPSATSILQKVTGKQVRRYSTYDFGRERDSSCISVIVAEAESRKYLETLRKTIPLGYVAFVGTSRWLGDEKHEGVELVIGKGQSQFDILKLARSDAVNYDMQTDDLIRKLREYHEAYGIDIWGAETDTIQFRLLKAPPDMKKFAEDLYKFCPDIVDQGTESVDALADEVRKSQEVFLWWD
jgi:hypothetical protein